MTRNEWLKLLSELENGKIQARIGELREIRKKMALRIAKEAIEEWPQVSETDDTDDLWWTILGSGAFIKSLMEDASRELTVMVKKARREAKKAAKAKK